MQRYRIGAVPLVASTHQYPRARLSQVLGLPNTLRNATSHRLNVLPDGIMLQGFHWESSLPDCRDPEQWPEGEAGSSWYQTVKAKVEDIREAGFTDIWLPPPSQSVSREGYLPTKLYDLNSAYGSQEELVSLLSELHFNGVGAVLDAVLNHRCGDRQDEDGRWVLFTDELGHDNRRLDWGPWALVSNHPDPALAGTGAPKDQIVYHAAPNIDHSNPEVREAIISWLNYMTRPRNLAYSSMRFDFVLGYAGKYIKEYVDSTVYPRGELCVAEWWYDGGIGDPGFTTPEMLEGYLAEVGEHAGVFDFPLKTTLHLAAKNNDWSLLGSSESLPGLMGKKPHLSFTFIDNHDTSAPQSHFPFPDSIPKLLAAYAYLLSHPGIPCVFWPHVYGKKNADGITNGCEPDVSLTEEAGRIDLRGIWVPPNVPGFSWEEQWPGKEPWSVESQAGVQGPIYTGICGEEIKKMTRARSAAGVHSSSQVRVLESRKTLYKAVVTGRTVYGSSRSGTSKEKGVYQLLLAVGPEAEELEVSPSEWKLVSRGAMHAVYMSLVEMDSDSEQMGAIDAAHPHTSMGPAGFLGGGPAVSSEEIEPSTAAGAKLN